MAERFTRVTRAKALEDIRKSHEDESLMTEQGDAGRCKSFLNKSGPRYGFLCVTL